MSLQPDILHCLDIYMKNEGFQLGMDFFFSAQLAMRALLSKVSRI
jgi:hypothetical protein